MPAAWSGDQAGRGERGGECGAKGTYDTVILIITIIVFIAGIIYDTVQIWLAANGGPCVGG